MITRSWTTTRRGAAALLGAAALVMVPACSAEQGPQQGARTGTGTGSGSGSGPEAQTGTEAGSGEPTAPGPGAPTGAAASGAATTLVRMDVRGGEVDGPTRTEVPLGEVVRLTVTADAPDQVHVHGYDRTLDLQPGTPATVEFVADIPGVFEIELHESGLPLTRLQVR